jgi:hypothetical protein
MTADWNDSTYRPYLGYMYVVDADDFYWQNAVSYIIAAHLQMLLFEKVLFCTCDPQKQNIWTVNRLVEHKTTLLQEEIVLRIELSPDKWRESVFNFVSSSKF